MHLAAHILLSRFIFKFVGALFASLGTLLPHTHTHTCCAHCIWRKLSGGIENDFLVSRPTRARVLSIRLHQHESQLLLQCFISMCFLFICSYTHTHTLSRSRNALTKIGYANRKLWFHVLFVQLHNIITYYEALAIVCSRSFFLGCIFSVSPLETKNVSITWKAQWAAICSGNDGYSAKQTRGRANLRQG